MRFAHTHCFYILAEAPGCVVDKRTVSFSQFDSVGEAWAECKRMCGWGRKCCKRPSAKAE